MSTDSRQLYGSPDPAAATKIQALVRGRRSRTKVNEYITTLIEELLRSKEENYRTPHQLQSKNNTLLDDEEEQFVVPIEGDGDCDDDEEMETVVKVTFVDCEEGENADKSTTILMTTEATTTTTKIDNLIPVGGVTAKSEKTTTAEVTTTSLKPTAIAVESATKDHSVPVGANASLIPKKSVLTTTYSLASKKSQSTNKTTTTKMIPKNTLSRQRQKSSLVSRYLEAAAKSRDGSSNRQGAVVVHKLDIDRRSIHKNDDEEKEKRRMAEIEKDSRLAATATARFSTGKRQGTKTNVEKKGIDCAQQDQEHVEEKCTSYDKDAIIKIQALVRGMLGRQEVAEYVTSLIEELLIETTAATVHTIISGKRNDDENQSSSGKPASKTREIIQTKEREEDKEAEEDDPKEDENDEYDETDRLPLWWMKYVPHDTHNDTHNMEEYENNNDDPTDQTDREESNKIIDIVYRPLRTKESSKNSTKRRKFILAKIFEVTSRGANDEG